MTDASGGGERDPGQRPATTNELLADLVQSGDFLDVRVARAKALAGALGGMSAQYSGLEVPPEADGAATQGVSRLSGLPGGEWAAEATRLSTDLGAAQIRKIVGGYGSRLGRIIGHVFGNEEGELTSPPPPEQLQQVITLDSLIGMAGAQPVIVLKPAKTWMDVSLLRKPDISVLRKPRDITEDNGLQYLQSSRGITRSIVLPAPGSVAIDIGTGEEPGSDDPQQDDELHVRSLRKAKGKLTPSIIDPLQTRMLLTSEDAEEALTDPTKTYILVGYHHLYKLLNHILGFDMSQAGNVYDDAASKFYTAIQVQKRLEEEAGAIIDADFIDGYLDFRIAMLGEAMEDTGPLTPLSSPYQQQQMAKMQQAHNLLTDGDWISRPDQDQ